MADATYEKYVDEDFTSEVDFTGKLRKGDTVIAAVATTRNASGSKTIDFPDANGSLPVGSNDIVPVRIRGGIPKEKYMIQIDAETLKGDKRQAFLAVTIKEP